MNANEIKEYMDFLQVLDDRHHDMRRRNVTFAQLSEGDQLYYTGWVDAGNKIIRYFDHLFPAGLEFKKFISVGGESFLLQAKQRTNGKLLACKVARKEFNEADREIDVPSGGFWSRNRTEIIENQIRKRFVDGLETQQKAYQLVKAEGKIPRVEYISPIPPVAGFLEWIDGETYNVFVRRVFVQDGGKVKIAEVFWRICRIFKQLHSQGIIHRDVKPENIIVSEDGIPWLTDFSIAKNLVDSNRDVNTVANMNIGDPRYSPPEQVYHGTAAEASYKSDVYSLGWLLYYSLVKDDPPSHVQHKLLRTHEKLRVPSVFRELFMRTTSEAMEARPDVDDFVAEVEEIYRREGVFLGHALKVKEQEDRLVELPRLLDRVAMIERKLDRIEESLKCLLKL